MDAGRGIGRTNRFQSSFWGRRGNPIAAVIIIVGRRRVFAQGVLAALAVDHNRPPIYRGAGARIDRRKFGD